MHEDIWEAGDFRMEEEIDEGRETRQQPIQGDNTGSDFVEVAPESQKPCRLDHPR